jgi:hypothetical protein
MFDPFIPSMDLLIIFARRARGFAILALHTIENQVFHYLYTAAKWTG